MHTKMTRNYRCQSSITNTRLTLSWILAKLLHSVYLWWNSRLLCHSRFAFQLSEAEMARDKTWGGDGECDITVLRGMRKSRAKCLCMWSDLWSAGQRLYMWLRWRGWAHNYALMVQRGKNCLEVLIGFYLMQFSTLLLRHEVSGETE